MDKKGGAHKQQKPSLEEKISMLSETEEAYVLGFIEGALLDDSKQGQNNLPGALSGQEKNKT